MTGDGAADLGDQAELGPAGRVQGADQLDDPWVLPRSPNAAATTRRTRLPVGGLGRTDGHSLDFKFT